MGAKKTGRRASELKKRKREDFTAAPLPTPQAVRRGRPRTSNSLPFTLTRLAGDRIAHARTICGWTQEELSTRSGVSQRDVSMYETGKRVPLFASVVKLADALGVSLDWLACRSNDSHLR